MEMNSTFNSLLENEREYKVTTMRNKRPACQSMIQTLDFLPNIGQHQVQKQKFSQRIVLTGTGIDQVAHENQKDLLKLKADNQLLVKQNDELKILNEKMVERMEFLQNVIDQEASANTYYYNYPPQPDYSGSHKV